MKQKKADYLQILQRELKDDDEEMWESESKRKREEVK